jgi:hypothetical protein
MNKPSPLRTEIFERLSCAFFDDLQTMMISLSSLMMISHVFIYKKSPIIDVEDEQRLDRLIELPFVGQTIKEAWSFKGYKPFKGIMDNRPTDQIEFIIYPPLGMPVKSIPNSHHVDQPTLFQQKIIGSAFSNFFENNRDKIEAKYGTDTSNWPTDWNFGRVIRNAYSHGGEIYFKNINAQPVSWRGINYAPKDNGKSIHLDIYVPEIIELMKDMQKHL